MELKRTHNKRAASLAMAVLLLMVFFVGCQQPEPATTTPPSTSGGTSTTTTTTQQKEEQVRLTLWGTPSGTLPGQQAGEWIEKDLMEAWNKLHPNVTFTVEMIPWDGINEKLTTAITSGQTPDVYLDYPGRILAYANMGAVVPLDDVIPADKLEKIHKNPDIMKMVSVNGEIVVMPYPTGIVQMCVNKTLWKNAGAEHLLPQNEYRTWTPEEFLEALRAVKDEANGVYGITLFALNEQGDQLYNNIMAGYGVKFFNDDYSKYIAAENPAAEEALALFRQIVDEKLCTPYPETISAVDAIDYFKQGKSGILGNANLTHIDIVLNGIADGSIDPSFEPMLVNYPSTTPNQATLKSEVGAGCVFKSGDAVKEEWGKEFLYWMYAENQLTYTAGSGFDIWGTEMEWVAALENPVKKAEAQYISKVLSKASEWPLIDPGWGIVGYPEMRAAMFPEMQSMFIGRTTPRETLDNISQKFNDIIEKYKAS